MVMWRKITQSLGAVVVLTMVTGGCGGGASVTNESSSGEPRRGGELVMAVNLEGKTMDPAWCAMYAPERCTPVFGTLMRYDIEDEQFVPGMAESFDSADGKKWTLRLRDGVKFSDGTVFDAQAVAFNWARIKDPATLSLAAQMAAPLTWTVVDPLTLDVTSEQVNFQLPWALTQGLGMIGSPTAMTTMGAEYGNAPVGAGPFVLDEWARNSEARFIANRDYWDAGVPYVDSFVLKVITQDDQRQNALRAGQIDINWSLIAQDADAMKAEGYTVHQLPLVGGTGLNFNLDDSDMKDPDLRQALLKAVDSAQITNAVYPGSSPADAFLFSDSPFRDDSRGTFPEKDLGQAQKLFDAYLAKVGESSLAVTLSSYAGIPDLELLAQMLQAQLQEIDGLTVDIKAMDSATLAGDRRAGAYQLTLAASLSQHMDALFDVFHSAESLNITGYSNPKVDTALETSRSSNDPDVIAEAYKVVNGEISKDAPMRIFRYQSGYIFAEKNVKDLTLVGTMAGAGVQVDRTWIDQ